MNPFRVSIRPLAAFGSPPLGDMLFGQLCWAVRNRFGEAALTELLDGYIEGRPWAVVSDAFPAGHVPRPALPGHRFDKVESLDRKSAAKRQWLPVERFDEPVERWLNHCVAGADLRGSLPEVHPQPHNTIHRLTGMTGTGQFAPYTMEQLWFGESRRTGDSDRESAPVSPQLELYVLLDEARMSRDAFTEVLEDVGAFGFGRDAAIGLGKFEVVSVEAYEFPHQSCADAWLTLAPSAPQGLDFDPERSFYKTFTRFGRHGDIGVHQGNPFKTPVLLAQAGALLAPRTGIDAVAAPGFVGQGLGGGSALSKAVPGTVQQGYAPAFAVRLPALRHNVVE